jgi:hypothetical protein
MDLAKHGLEIIGGLVSKFLKQMVHQININLGGPTSRLYKG